jgi:tetratricopeptide (TPR) repeat protein
MTQISGCDRKGASFALTLFLTAAPLTLAETDPWATPQPHTETLATRLDRIPLPEPQKEQARKALDSRDYGTVETILVRAVSENPKSPDLLVFAARVFFADGNAMNAAIALKKAEKIRPLDIDERFTLAMAYIGIGKGAWARPELERLAAGDPRNTLYSYWLARTDYDDRKYDSAIDRLRAVTMSNPQFARAWDNLGLCLEATGKLDEAAASYREAIRLNREHNPTSPWPPLNLGSLLTKGGDLKEGEALLREALRYDPKLAEAHYRMGLNLHKQNRDEEAVAELRSASDLDPSATEPLYILGQIYRTQGNTQAAEEVFARFKELKKKRRGT